MRGPVHETHHVVLSVAPPFDFASALAYLRASPSSVLERIGDDGCYRRALTLAGADVPVDVLVSVWSTGCVQTPQLVVEVAGVGTDDVVLAEALRRVRHVFNLDADPTDFLALGQADPIFGQLVRRYYGLRPVLIPEPYETLMWAVLGQQVNVAFARTMKRSLVAACGRELRVGNEAYPLLPEPQRVAALDAETLRALHFSRQKAEYTLGLAQAVASGALSFDELAALPYDEALRQLTALRGVGRWTAEYVLMRGLGARDSIPAADLGLRAILGQWYGLGRKATEGEVRTLAERWAGWRGWAAFYWWHALQDRLAPTTCA